MPPTHRTAGGNTVSPWRRCIGPLVLLLSWSTDGWTDGPGPDALEWVLASSEATSWEAAQVLCADLEHAGRDDWRLPSVQELALDTATLPPSLAKTLGDEAIAAWACNAPEEPFDWPEPGAEELNRVSREEAELERRLYELERLDGFHAGRGPIRGHSVRGRLDPRGGRTPLSSSIRGRAVLLDRGLRG